MAINLRELSDQLASVVTTAAGSVVTVAARSGKPASGTVWEAGVVVTSSHAIQDDENIAVRDAGGEHKATLVGRDPGTDLAVLRVEGLQATAAPRATEVHPGNIVLAIGRPGDVQATVGTVVSTASRQRSWRGGLEGLVLSDAHLYEGFSGGPLVDVEGRVVGLNSWYYGRGSTRSVTADTAERLVRSLLAHGRVKKPYLGIGTQPVELSADMAAKAGQGRGLLLISVAEGSPAARAGLLQGDTLIGLDGASVGGMRDFFRLLQGVEVDSQHTLRVIRGGELTDVKVTVGEREEETQE